MDYAEFAIKLVEIEPNSTANNESDSEPAQKMSKKQKKKSKKPQLIKQAVQKYPAFFCSKETIRVKKNGEYSVQI